MTNTLKKCRVFAIIFPAPVDKDTEERLISYFQNVQKAIVDEAKEWVRGVRKAEAINIPGFGETYRLLTSNIGVQMNAIIWGKHFVMDKMDEQTYRFAYTHDISNGAFVKLRVYERLQENAMARELKLKFPGIEIRAADDIMETS